MAPALASKKSTSRALSRYDPRRSAGRFTASLALGLATAYALPGRAGWALRTVAGWDVAAATLLGLTWWMIGKADAAETHRRAAAEDPGRTALWLVTLVSSAMSLFTATVLLRQAKHLAGRDSGMLVALSLFSVACAWAVTHTSYTLRYAHLYYRHDCDADEEDGGLTFPGEDPPSDIDFAYFAFTIGMCFQTSDISVTTRPIRRTVLGQSILSFAYNTAIIALSLNLVSGLLD